MLGKSETEPNVPVQTSVGVVLWATLIILQLIYIYKYIYVQYTAAFIWIKQLQPSCSKNISVTLIDLVGRFTESVFLQLVVMKVKK